MAKKQQIAGATPKAGETRGIVRLPLELPVELNDRLKEAMAKKFPGANRTYVLRHLIEKFCNETKV